MLVNDPSNNITLFPFRRESLSILSVDSENIFMVKMEEYIPKEEKPFFRGMN